MGIVHAALRRDLDRAALVTGTAQLHTHERIRDIGAHLVWCMELLHHHHSGEDERLYPMVRAKDPSAAKLIDDMHREHEAILDAMAGLEAAGRDAADAATPVEVRAGRLHWELAALRSVLDPHLEHEEMEAMPVVQRVLTRAEWDDFEASAAAQPKKALAFSGQWLIDGLDQEHRRLMLQVIPPVPRFLMVHVMGGAYKRRRAALWAGTPAERIGSVPLSSRA